MLAGCSSDPEPVASPPLTKAPGVPVTSPPARSTPAPTRTTPSKAQVLARIKAGIAKIADDEPKGSVSAAVTSIDGGPVYSFGSKRGMRMASTYKLLVLETALRRNDGPLGGSQADLATPMIENSDNVAAYSLYQSAGGCSALRSTVSKLKMRNTDVACDDPTYTRTSAPDMLNALRAVTGEGGTGSSLLSSSSRSYARRLMSNVAKDQRWGVGVVASPKGDFYNKNGWLGFDDDNGRWAVTSVGVVQVGARKLLMAVYTQHQSDYDTGVELNEKIARLVAPAAL